MEKIKLEVNPRYRHLEKAIASLARDMIAGKDRAHSEGVTDKYLPTGARYIYEGRNNLFRIEMGGLPMIVKDFKRPHIINRFVYTNFRKSKARRSYENAGQMLALGFQTPEPVAYCEVKRGAALRWSFYISLELQGATEMREWEKNPDAEALLPQFAAEMLRLHRSGVWHKDFSPGNILYTKGSDGSFRFYYVDLNRMKFGVHDRKRQMRMFRAINTDRRQTEILGRLYAEAAGLNAEAMGAEAARQLDAYLRRQRLKGK